MSIRPHVTIYTDGAAKGNPGPGGYGAVLISEKPSAQKELSGGENPTTNNRMELMGVICALEALTRPCAIDLYSDSSYVINAFNKGWLEKWKRNGWRKSVKEPLKNVELWQRLDAAAQPHTVNWHWVKGHAGNTYNELADSLASNAALKAAE